MSTSSCKQTAAELGHLIVDAQFTRTQTQERRRTHSAFTHSMIKTGMFLYSTIVYKKGTTAVSVGSFGNRGCHRAVLKSHTEAHGNMLACLVQSRHAKVAQRRTFLQ